MTRRDTWLVWGMVLLAAHVGAVGLLDPLKNIWPPRQNDLLWRIVLGAQFLNGVGLLLAGMGILAVVGFARRSRALLITLAILATVAAVGIGALSGSTALDYLQIRGGVVRERVAEWDRNVFFPILTGGLSLVVLAFMVIGSLAAARQARPARREGSHAPIVVG
jgi:hypothetical protein